MFSGIERALLYKAQVVAPRIHNVERALAPGAPEDIGSGLTVDRVGSQSVELRGALVDGVDIAYGEVERLRARAGRDTGLGRIDDGTALKVLTRTGWRWPGVLNSRA